MKRTYLFLIAVIFSASLISCAGEGKQDANSDAKKVNSDAIAGLNYTQLLLDEIIKNGDIINTKRVPTMIKAKGVKKNLGDKQLIIDLRSAKDFSNGHIKGAVNIPLSGLNMYFSSNDTKSYDKVVMVCHSGQTASYATSIMQMMGNKNVYAMKWGMSVWNSKFSSKWLNGISDKYSAQLETSENAKGTKGDLPKFECKEKTGQKILNKRAKKLMKDGYKSVMITADDIFANPDKYYIINYWPSKLYNLGHISGAIQYNPKKSLKTSIDLLTIPTGKTVVTYCFTGQHSAFVTAYLKMLGYDARSLKFGANSFMNKKMRDNKDIGHGFSKKVVHDYKFETSKYEGGATSDEEEGGC